MEMTHQMSKEAKINSIENLYQSDWLSLDKAHWEKSNGSKFGWEYVKRNQCSNIVMIIPIMKHNGKHVLVRQFRPPVGRYTLEFPAGLVDIGENIETAAKRELLEETGYRGKIISRLPDRAVSAGLCSEIITVFHIQIDENEDANLHPKQNLDESEELEVILASKDALRELVYENKSTDLIDVKLSLYCSGLFI